VESAAFFDDPRHFAEYALHMLDILYCKHDNGFAERFRGEHREIFHSSCSVLDFRRLFFGERNKIVADIKSAHRRAFCRERAREISFSRGKIEDRIVLLRFDKAKQPTDRKKSVN